MKIAFQNGQKPVTEFNDDDGSLEVSDIVRLLETRCQSYLQQYINLDDDQSGTYGWMKSNQLSNSFIQICGTHNGKKMMEKTSG